MKLTHLKERPKFDKGATSERYVKHLIWGNDIATNLLANQLKQNSEEFLILVSDKKYIDFSINPGPSLFRGVENKKALKSVYPELEILDRHQVAYFYKDQKFYPFGGKKAPATMMEGEDFFNLASFNADLEQVSNQPIEAEMFTVQEIKKIEKATPTDMLRPQNWKIILNDESIIFCQHLYWNSPPAQFLKLFSGKNELSNEFHEYCVKSKYPYCLVWEATLSGPVTDQKGTLFIPQSLTYDWGNFIGEFVESEGKYTAKFLTYIADGDTTSDKLTAKVKLLKRSLRRVFEDFDKKFLTDKIWVSERIPCPEIKDELFKNATEELPHLHFIGANAPLDDMFVKRIANEDDQELILKDLTNNVRSILSFHQIKENVNTVMSQNFSS